MRPNPPCADPVLPQQSRTRRDAGVAANHCCNKRPVLDLSLPHPPRLHGWGGTGRVSTRRAGNPSASDIYICVHGRRGDIQGVVAVRCSLGTRRGISYDDMVWLAASMYLERADGAIEFKRI